MFRTILITIVLLLPATLLAQADSVHFAKCKVTCSWSRTGEDAVVTVTIKNGSKKTLVDPKVRVTFYDKDGNELTTDAKMYFVRIGPGKSKTMEGRIWDFVSEAAVKEKTKSELEGGYFE